MNNGIIYRAHVRVDLRAGSIEDAAALLRWQLHDWRVELAKALQFRQEMRYYYPQIFKVNGEQESYNFHLKFFNE